MTDALWRLARRILFLLAPETAHHVAMASLGLLLRVPGVRGWARRRLVVRDRRLETSVAGLRLPNPVGLAAGFDKDARWFEDLGVLGFGFVEIGTLTAHAQPGNPRPRLFRLPADRALINRMGFNNGGSAAAEPRLAARRPGELVVGANIGKSKVTPNDDALADYLQSYDRLARHADYVTVNVSSPNTAGLRDLQEANALRALLAGLLERVRAATEATGRHRPLFVKIAPDLDDDARDAIVDLAVELGLDGIVATNTTIDRSGLATPRDVVDAIGAGGLSGAPLKVRSRAFVGALARRAAGRLAIIGVGGIEDADDAWEMLRAGASAVQLYTGFIYGGPLTVARINRELARRVETHGLASIAELTAAGA